jgi:hypothetical protein
MVPDVAAPQGLWPPQAGWSLWLVAEFLGAYYRSVQRWVAWYREGGVPEVRGHWMGGIGQPSFLTAAAQVGIADVVASRRFHTAAEIRG